MSGRGQAPRRDTLAVTTLLFARPQLRHVFPIADSIAMSVLWGA